MGPSRLGPLLNRPLGDKCRDANESFDQGEHTYSWTQAFLQGASLAPRIRRAGPPALKSGFKRSIAKSGKSSSLRD
jgi:hypothetical protein